MNLAASGVRAPSRIRQYRETRATVVRIGLAAYQPIRFKSINQLGYVRFHARQSIGQLPQRQRIAGQPDSQFIVRRTERWETDRLADKHAQRAGRIQRRGHRT